LPFIRKGQLYYQNWEGGGDKRCGEQTREYRISGKVSKFLGISERNVIFALNQFSEEF
jgi:hypothetical protein